MQKDNKLIPPAQLRSSPLTNQPCSQPPFPQPIATNINPKTFALAYGAPWKGGKG